MISLGGVVRQMYRNKSKKNMHYESWIAYRNASLLIESEDIVAYDNEKFSFICRANLDRDRLTCSKGITYW